MQFESMTITAIRHLAQLGRSGDPQIDQIISIARMVIQRDDFPSHIHRNPNSAFQPMTQDEVMHLLFGAPSYTHVKQED